MYICSQNQSKFIVDTKGRFGKTQNGRIDAKGLMTQWLQNRFKRYHYLNQVNIINIGMSNPDVVGPTIGINIR